MQSKDQETSSHLAGTVITILFFGCVLGLIGYGGYVTYSIMNREVEVIEFIDEESTTTKTTTTITTKEVTTTKRIEGSEHTLGTHKMIIPDGYRIVSTNFDPNSEASIQLINSSDAGETYSIGVNSGSFGTANKDVINSMFSQLGYSDLTRKKLFTKAYYTSSGPVNNGYNQGIIISDKGSYYVMIVYTIKGDKLSEENGYILSQLMENIR